MATVILAVIPTGTVVIHTDTDTGPVTVTDTGPVTVTGPDTDTDTRPAIIGIIIVAFTDTTIIGNSRTIRSN